jgi:exodeoxyribonuclease VII small subunit
MQPIESMSFEDSLSELEAIVRRLEEGKTNLEEAMGAYERGAALRAHCEKKLKDARLRVEQIVVGVDGTITTKASELGSE